MYVDEIDQESLTLEWLINLIFTEFVHRQIQQLEKQGTCEKTNSDLWTNFRECCRASNEDERWLNYADKAISMIDRGDMWQGILEACKVLKYPKPSIACRHYFETLFNLAWFMWPEMYSETERTVSINNSIGYVMCICQLKKDSTG